MKLLLGFALLKVLAAIRINAAEKINEFSSVKKHPTECDACAFAVLGAKKTMETLPQQALEDFGVSGWLANLKEACAEDEGCDALVTSLRGKALAGYLADIVEEGEEASERRMDTAAFQEELCSSVAEVCPKRHPFASVRSVTFTIEDSSSEGDGSSDSSDSSDGGDGGGGSGGSGGGAGKFKEDVGFYRRGDAQAGPLPAQPALVLPAGHSHTLRHTDAAESTALKQGTSFRLLPVEDFDCVHNDMPGICEVPCSVESAEDAILAMEQVEIKDEEAANKKKKHKGKGRQSPSKSDPAMVRKESALKREQLEAVIAREGMDSGSAGGGGGLIVGGGASTQCLAAEWACAAVQECVTISVSFDGTAGRLKRLGGGGWESARATDVFLDDDLRQEFIVRRNPKFDPSMPDFVPDPTATMPEGWNEEDDGLWEAPEVSNAAALRSNPRFLVYKKYLADEGHTPGPPPAPPQHVTDAAGWSWDSAATAPMLPPSAAPVVPAKKKKKKPNKKTKITPKKSEL